MDADGGARMAKRISFDVDDTLVCGRETPMEPNRVPRLLRFWFNEPLRLGAPALMKTLIDEGWEIAIYTTSYRSSRYLRRWLRFHGIRIGLVVNQEIHDREVRQGPYRDGPSKLPNRFRINVHVDDSDGVRMEAQQHGFEVVIVKPTDSDWDKKVLEAARRVARRMEAD